MDLLLKCHVSVIRRLYKTQTDVTVDEINNMLDDIVSHLNTTQTQREGLHVLTIICHELAPANVLKLFDNVKIMKHKFFIIIGRTLEMLLTKATFISMTKDDEQCLYALSHLIVHLCLYRNKPFTSFSIYRDMTSQLSYQNIFLTQSFFDKFVRIIADDLAINEYESYHIKYKVINHLLYLCTELIHIDHSLLLDSIVQCLRSPFYLNAYETIDFRQSIINPKQWFFIYQCPLFIRLHSYERQDEISNSMCESILEYSIKIFEQYLPILLGDENAASRENIVDKDQSANVRAISWHIELLNHFALTQETRIHFMTGIHRTIVDYLVNVLRTDDTLTERVPNNLISYVLILLYNLTFEEKICCVLKDNNVLGLCTKLQQAKDRRIQFASQTLVALLNQKSIDEIDYPLNMAENYLFYIENTIDKPSQTYSGIKLDGILANLEVMAQNDLIKENIGNDHNGLSLLVRCVLDENLNFETIQCSALRIIDALSFANQNVCKKISKNEKLMNLVRHLSETNDLTSLGSIAKRIRWKVEDEKDFILKQTKIHCETYDDNQTSSQHIRLNNHWDLFDNKTSDMFNLMISYHRNDKEICSQIYDRLKASNYYRVSFDSDHVHEMVPGVMAEAIETSSTVLICFSDHYKKSYSCRLEAEYAEKRTRSVIPVKLDELYCPTGWLENIVNNKLCIEFSSLNFSGACASLIQQISDVKEKLDQSTS